MWFPKRHHVLGNSNRVGRKVTRKLQLKLKRTNSYKLQIILFPTLFASSASLFFPLTSSHSSFSLPSASPEGPYLNPREKGRSLRRRGRAGNPWSDPGQFNYPVFFHFATRVPILQPTPLMRPGLASLTFNDLPIDALGFSAPTHRLTNTQTSFYQSEKFESERKMPSKLSKAEE